MRKTFTYKNKRTNETTESKEQAKIWYEAGDEIEQWYKYSFSCDTLNEVKESL